tara:strand:- start:159 stop:311 length:153 start_codon:yes stop_codon:yes gene_type:complete
MKEYPEFLKSGISPENGSILNSGIEGFIEILFFNIRIIRIKNNNKIYFKN